MIDNLYTEAADALHAAHTLAGNYLAGRIDADKAEQAADALRDKAIWLRRDIALHSWRNERTAAAAARLADQAITEAQAVMDRRANA